MLYRGMDRAQLDAAYNNTAAVPERNAIVADWAARSAKVRREHAGHLDIAYGESPRERLDRIVAEIRRSAQWLADHLGDYGADPSRLYVSGHSAGGHLTACAMTLPVVRGGIAISGIYDLEPIRLNYLNEKLGLDREEAERNSPQSHIPSTAAELVITYGTAELPELCRQSIDYAHAWLGQGLRGQLLPVD